MAKSQKGPGNLVRKLTKHHNAGVGAQVSKLRGGRLGEENSKPHWGAIDICHLAPRPDLTQVDPIEEISSEPEGQKSVCAMTQEELDFIWASITIPGNRRGCLAQMEIALETGMRISELAVIWDKNDWIVGSDTRIQQTERDIAALRKTRRELTRNQKNWAIPALIRKPSNE